MDLIMEQSWGAQKFPCQGPIMKCLKSLGMVSPPYVRLEFPYAVLTLCDMRWILSSMIIIDGRGVPRRFKDDMVDG